MNRNKTKKEILEIWKTNVYGKKLLQGDLNSQFCGLAGHLLESAFNLKVNNKNYSDFLALELKLYSKMITFGDWKGTFLWEKDLNISRKTFLSYFGRYNKKKKNFYWTSPAIPKFGDFSYRGFFFELKKNELNLNYDFEKDSNSFLVSDPKFHTIVTLVQWNIKDLKIKYLNKFSGNIILAKKIKGVHKKLLILNNLSWDSFFSKLKKKIIKLDPCISTKCLRNRCLFRIPIIDLLNLGYKEYTIVNNKLVKKIIVGVLDN